MFKQQPFTSQDVEILNTDTVYRGFFQMLKYRLRHRLFAGGWSEPLSRELFERGHAVVVLPYDPQCDQIVVLEQFRIGALQEKNGPWLLEFVAGMVEKGESIEQVAMREAEEEAGLQLLDMEKIAHCLVSPGGTSEALDIFCARVDCSQVGGVHGLDSEHEDIRVSVLDWSEAEVLFEQGRFNSAGPLIAIQWLIMNRQRLRSEWC